MGANGGVNLSGIHEAVPIAGVDSINATARWKVASGGGAPQLHSIASLPEGRYMGIPSGEGDAVFTRLLLGLLN